jgi:hypothetical protein
MAMRVVPLIAIVLCGCYVNVPLATVPPPGERVHVALTDQGSVDLAQYLGRNIGSVDGRLLDGNDSTLVLSVSQVSTRGGEDDFWKGESVTLPRRSIATMEKRKLSFWRSGLIASALVGGLAIIAGSGITGSSGGETAPPTQTPR